MFETVQHAVLAHHGNKAADHGLGGGVDVVRDVAGVGCVIGIEHDASVARDQEAVETLGFAIGDDLREFGRIHAFLFGRRHLPVRNRPDRRLDGAQFSAAEADCQQQDNDGVHESGKSGAVAGHRAFQAHVGEQRPTVRNDGMISTYAGVTKIMVLWI